MDKKFSNFANFENQIKSGLITLLCVITALIFANTSISSIYFDFLNTKISFSIGSFIISKSTQLWINDGLMTLFFLLIGFEIKREIIAGELSSLRAAIYPIIAAMGGMILPILIFLLFNYNQETVRGWAIPMSTDIAFTVSILLILGKRISKPLKVAVTSIAIIDDIVALVVIAVFYSQNISLLYLSIVLGLSLGTLFINKMGTFHGSLYLGIGILIWLLFLKSGIHPTIAGVLIAFLIPSNTKVDFAEFKKRIYFQVARINDTFLNKDIHFEHADMDSKESFGEINSILKNIEPQLQRYEHSIKNTVSFFVVPIFAFVNSGIVFSHVKLEYLFSSLALGIIFALMIGKSTGIYLFSLFSVKMKITDIPKDTTLTKIYGISWLSGIGFTMSIFIADLSFHDEILLNVAKISIFIGSAFSAIIGIMILIFGIENGDKKV